MKKWNKLICCNLILMTVMYTGSPILTYAVEKNTTEETLATESSNSELQQSNPIEDQGHETKDSIEDDYTNSTMESIESSNDAQKMYVVADLSAFIDREVKVTPESESNVQLAEAESGDAYIDTKESTVNQNVILHLTEDGWYTIQNSITNNCLTVLDTDDAAAKSLYYTVAQGTDTQKWRLVSEENGAYLIQSKNNLFLKIADSNKLQVTSEGAEQRWKLEFPPADSQVSEETTTSTTVEATSESSEKVDKYESAAASVNVVTTTSVSESKIKITIANLEGTNVSNVKFPTWSNTNGQDDIKWLNGTRNPDGSWSVIVDSADFKDSGLFQTHIYVTENGRDKGVGKTSYSLEAPPANVITTTSVSKTKMKVTIANLESKNVSNVKFPTWSNTNGQDDIKWLNGTRNSDGSWSVIVDSAEFRHSGLFNTHVYITENGRDKGVGKTSYSLEAPPANVITTTSVSKTKMKVTIANLESKNVSNVKFPTWSNTNGQDDIKWLNGTRNSDGSWSVIVDSAEFRHSGLFNTHVYITENGHDKGVGKTSYSLEAPPANVITTTSLSKTRVRVTIANPNGGNVSNVKFPTWSNTNGQDDIKWLNGTRNSDGSWSVVVDSSDFRNGGVFNTHVYITENGRDKGVGKISYSLELPSNVITKTSLSKTKMRVRIYNLSGGNISNVKFPTWSNTNGQDDIKWLNGTRHSDGSWSVVVNSADFKHGGLFHTHIYATENGRDKGVGSTSYNLEQDEVAIRLSKPPYYYSQLDGRWSNLNYGIANLGAAGCVPTSMAMILRGHFGVNVSPIDTANRIYSYGGFNQKYFGASGIDFVKGMNSYGRTVLTVNSLSELNDYLAKGYPVVMFVNVGIGHAIVTQGYSNGKTTVYDPYGKQFYNGAVSTSHLWNTPSNDSIDWSAGRPYFVIK
ncbi:GBS Bsp-like repeat-containing protein [Enterococcus sp. LJL51]|uniref:GBS Bsp-like repeat-containing protein n=1 Tax=Enterococcus sp. LJL51 TaxID=3416656 RepID=UPI003CE7B999